jgi:hypothetical protein
MELLAHLSEVERRLVEGFSAAARLMSADLHGFLSSEQLAESNQDFINHSMWLLSCGLVEGSGYNKDRGKVHKIAQQTAHIYAGVPREVAKWGHEAHGFGAHAFGMDRAGKAPSDKVMQAHQHAASAHANAEQRLRAGGFDSAADLHKHAQSYHQRRIYALQEPKKKAEAVEDPRAELHQATIHAHMAQWRAQKLKNKLGKMPKQPAAIQSTHMIGGVRSAPGTSEAVERLRFQAQWSGLDEAGKYEDEVKRASKIAASASAIAKDNGTPEQHGTASRLHFIAHGVAKAHGHNDLAQKHLEFHKQHSAAADAARQAGAAS